MSRSSRRKQIDIGLLLIRVTVGGSMLAFHGIPKLMKGPEVWEKIGVAMSNIGIHFFTPFWGFAATMAETVGALFVILGLFLRPSAAVLAFTMLIAFISHLSKGDSLAAASHPLELMLVLIALVITGAGSYAIDKK